MPEGGRGQTRGRVSFLPVPGAPDGRHDTTRGGASGGADGAENAQTAARAGAGLTGVPD